MLNQDPAWSPSILDVSLKSSELPAVGTHDFRSRLGHVGAGDEVGDRIARYVDLAGGGGHEALEFLAFEMALQFPGCVDDRQ